MGLGITSLTRTHALDSLQKWGYYLGMKRILILSAVVSGAFVESITWAANVPFGGMCEPDESNNWCGQTGSAGFGTFELLIAVIVILYVYRLIKKVALESKEKRQERIQLIKQGLFGIAIAGTLIFAVLLLLEYDDKTRTKESKTLEEMMLDPSLLRAKLKVFGSI